jgi:CxxC-x17-CxxC domain-containing protein
MGFALVEQTLVCQDCEQSFVFSVAEQAFYAERGFRHPARCPDCRARRRADRNADVIRAQESTCAVVWQEGFGNYGGGAVNGNGRSRRPARSAGPRFAFPAVCTTCGRDTEVPFAPRHGRPVYCRECFDARRGR